MRVRGKVRGGGGRKREGCVGETRGKAERRGRRGYGLWEGRGWSRETLVVMVTNQ